MQQLRPVLDLPFSPQHYQPVALSGQGPEAYRTHLNRAFERSRASVLYGGYLEVRQLYGAYTHFGREPGGERNIHLGLDFWAPTGTRVLVPADGRVHSWSNRASPGDYGPVVILEHPGEKGKYYTLYGHLSRESLTGLEKDRLFRTGEQLGFLGSESENGGYLPHLHFQLIRDIGAWDGDYPGVCAAQSLDFYAQNCPDPRPFLGLF